MKRIIKQNSFIEGNAQVRSLIVLTAAAILIMGTSANAQNAGCTEDAMGNISCPSARVAAAQSAEPAPARHSSRANPSNPAGPQAEAPEAPSTSDIATARVRSARALDAFVALGVHNLGPRSEANGEFQVGFLYRHENGQFQVHVGAGDYFSAGASGAARIPIYCNRINPRSDTRVCAVGMVQGLGQVGFRAAGQRGVAAAGGIGVGLESGDRRFSGALGIGPAMRFMDGRQAYIAPADPAILASFRLSPHERFYVGGDGAIITAPRQRNGHWMVDPGLMLTTRVGSNLTPWLDVGIQTQVMTGISSRGNADGSEARDVEGAQVSSQFMVGVNFDRLGNSAN